MKLFKRVFVVLAGTVLCLTGCKNHKKFMLNFMVDDSLYVSVETDGIEPISIPEDPKKEDYYFEGWFWDNKVYEDEFSNQSLIERNLKSDTNVYAYFVDDTYIRGADLRIKNSSEIDVEGVGKVFYLTQPSSQVLFRFEDHVQVNRFATWTVSTDLSGSNVINSRTVELSSGNNPLYYIHVTGKDGSHQTHILLIHRNYNYEVSFNSNGGTSCASQTIEEGSKLTKVPQSSKTGYTFLGWDYDFNEPITHSFTANALWSANQYTVTFNTNGGNPLPSSSLIVTYNNSFTLPTPTRTGYEFVGWYNGSTKINSGNWTYTSDMSLTAHWNIITYSITYNLNGGDSSQISLQTTYNVENEFTLQSPSRTGYTFKGWATSQTGSGIINYKVNRGTTGDLQFYAIWQANQYTVTYDVNGGDPLASNTQAVTYGSEYILSTPTRTGYEFAGWYNGSIKVNNGTWSTPNDLSLNAHWTISGYNIIYHFNGGSVTGYLPQNYSINDLGKDELDEGILSNLPTRTGYSLDGLFEDELFSHSYIPFEEQTYVGDKNIYYKWTPNQYTITFNVNGGNPLDSNTMNVDYDSEYFLPVPTRDGYSFQGWYNGTQKVEDGIWTLLDDLSLTAKWSINTYNISYELDGGINNISNPNNFTYEDESFVLYDPSKTGYEFLGWSFTSDGTPIKNLQVDHNTHENLSAYAFWNANTYHVTFDPAGGTGVTQLETDVVFDSMFTLPNVSRTGYTFVGWYEGETKFNSGTWSTAKDVDLVALWSPIQYTITYELDDGVNNVDNPSFYLYDDEDITLKDPHKDGYTFLGWTSLNISTPTKNVVIPHHSQGAKEFTANWKINEYIITYDVNGGDVLDSSTQRVTYGDDFTLKTPTRPGYTFAGWYDGGTLVTSGTWQYLDDLSLVAHWNIITYSITYILNGGSNDINNPSSYNYDDETITLSDASRTGYTFQGWYDNDETLVTNINHNSIGDVVLNARWEANLNTLTVTSEDTSKGTVSIDSGSGYSDEQITVSATTIDDCVFKGWFANGVKVSNEIIYTFSMPCSDYSLVGHFFTYEEEQAEIAWNRAHGVIPVYDTSDNIVTYGLYPQTHVNDETLVNSLNLLTETDNNGWYLYDNEYYSKQVAGSPYNSGCIFSTNVKVYTGTTYWFKCEPIQWKILSSDNNYVVSKYVLDCGRYYRSSGTRTIDGKTVYASNYQYSDLREWLNNAFFNSAFYLGSEKLVQTNVDNSAQSNRASSKNYCCDTTYDNVFTPSYADYLRSDYGFDDSVSATLTRKAKVTDLARAKGAAYDSSDGTNYCAYYWTRSPYDNLYIDVVFANGSISHSVFGNNNHVAANIAITGIRPSIVLA